MRETLRSQVLEEALLTREGPWTGVGVHASLDSTNAEASRLRRLWYAVCADHQEGGRGRLGRSWVDVPRASIAVSVLVPRPEGALGWLPLLAGLAVRRAVLEVAGVETVLKWPNDVLVPADGGRKVAGVLCELTPAGVVVGTGVNVDQEREELPVETATSLGLAGATGLSREVLCAAYLRELAVVHAALTGSREARARVQQDYRAACATLGGEVGLHRPDGRTEHGRALDVDDDGRLVVDIEGRVDTVAAGDVEHVRPPRRG